MVESRDLEDQPPCTVMHSLHPQEPSCFFGSHAVSSFKVLFHYLTISYSTSILPTSSYRFDLSGRGRLLGDPQLCAIDKPITRLKLKVERLIWSRILSLLFFFRYIECAAQSRLDKCLVPKWHINLTQFVGNDGVKPGSRRKRSSRGTR